MLFCFLPNLVVTQNYSKNITDIFTLDIPNSVPIAIPHIAECPRASEKKAILLFTIIVPNIANTGDTNIIAINAFS